MIFQWVVGAVIVLVLIIIVGFLFGLGFWAAYYWGMGEQVEAQRAATEVD